MLPGPVFNVELVTTARRRRYYAVRVGYGLSLLAILWQNYRSLIGWDDSRAGGEFSSNQLAGFARETFQGLMIVQGIAVLALTPAMVAGVIADEKQRKTLHYLLASRLTGAEIVLGKLMARLLHVGVFLAIGVPVVAALTLFGGVDPDDVLRITSGTATTAFGLAGLSILVSVVARRARDAILVTYLLELVWLFAPPILAANLPDNLPVVAARVATINDWLVASNPLTLIESLGIGTSPPVAYQVAWMCGLQGSAGLLCVALAVFRLRPGFRNEGAARQGKGRRWLARRPCGDDPMLWKERHAAGFRGVTRVVARLVGVLILMALIYEVAILAPAAFREVFTYGYGVTGTSSGRGEFNVFLRIAGMTGLYALSALGTAASAAGGVTGEKEEDTWTSLTATDLNGREILFAKMVGAVWGMRGLLAMMAALGLIGVAAGAVHPFGLIAVAVETAVFLWFAAALGTFFSLYLKTTTKALAATIAALIFVNGGYLLCCMPVWRETSAVGSGCSPLVYGASLISYQDVSDLFKSRAEREQMMFDFTDEITTLSIVGTLLYAVIAAALTLRMVLGFDRAVDRPDRAHQHVPRRTSPAFPPPE